VVVIFIIEDAIFITIVVVVVFVVVFHHDIRPFPAVLIFLIRKRVLEMQVICGFFVPFLAYSAAVVIEAASAGIPPLGTVAAGVDLSLATTPRWILTVLLPWLCRCSPLGTAPTLFVTETNLTLGTLPHLSRSTFSPKLLPVGRAFLLRALSKEKARSV
jgi:hypothetical protein